MPDQIKVIRGMHDILPADMSAWYQIEDGFRALVENYGYQQIRTPVIEKSALFQRSIGEVTDIVEKEMYTFLDRNGDSLSMRPENTASVVRAGIENGLITDQLQRFWYNGPMFRHERPQKGRYRQFYQLGAETFGMAGADIEAELIFLAARFWKFLGLSDINLEVNSLGSSETRRKYRDILVQYLKDNQQQLDEDSLRRLQTNPLRILDSKNPQMQQLIESAPQLQDSLDQESASHFAKFTDILDQTAVSYRINTRLVRGLDYYCHTVFEWKTDSLGAQGTVCGGGRYDGLVSQLGGKPGYAAGFSMGIERLVMMLQDQNKVQPDKDPDIYMVLLGEKTEISGQVLAESLRDQIKGLHLIVHSGGGSAKSQMKKANKSNSKFALIIGESEIEQGTINLKFLRENKDQIEIKQNQLADKLLPLLQINS